MRILVVNNLYPPQELGGYGRYISDFANILRDRGHYVKVMTSDAPYLGKVNPREEPHVDRSLQLCGTYSELPPTMLSDREQIRAVTAANTRRVKAAIEKEQLEACLLGNTDLLLPRIFDPLIEANIPIIHHLAFAHLPYPVSETPNTSLYHLSAASNFVKQQVLTEGYPHAEISIIFPGAFVDRYRMPCLPDLGQLRIAFASLVLPYKGPQTLVEALAILHDSGIEFRAQLAGDTPNSDFLKQLQTFAIAKGMQNKVEFLGYLPRPKLIELFGRSNVLVFPSVWEEPFGISQVEGMAAKLALVTSGTGGASEIVEANRSGLTFPAGNSLALAEALASLPADRQRWQRLIETGEERAREIFDIERSVDLLAAKFAEMLGVLLSDRPVRLSGVRDPLPAELRWREFALVAFPDWNASEASLTETLAAAIAAVATHPETARITLLLDTAEIAIEDAEDVVSGAVMTLVLDRGLDLDEEAEIVPLGALDARTWEALLSQLHGRLQLDSENRDRLTALGADRLPTYSPAQLPATFTASGDR